MKLMARLAEELNLIYHSPEVVEMATNKFLMKEAFLKNNIACAKGIHFSSSDQIDVKVIENFKFPLIIKPVDSFSSRGVYKIEKFEEINAHLDETISFSSDGSFLIEEFIDGPEFSIEAVTFNGTTEIIQFTEKIITPFPNTVEIGHIQPANLSSIEKQQITMVLNNVTNALSIKNSALHAELKMTKNGPVMIEIGARLGGDFISSYLTEASKGLSMDKAAIQIALGKKPDLSITKNIYSYIKYFELPVGYKVININNWQEILNSEDVVFANIAVSIGDVIEEITESKKRPGFVIVKGESREDVIIKAAFWENYLIQKISLGEV